MEGAKDTVIPHVYIAGRIQSGERFDLLDVVMTHKDNRNPSIAPKRFQVISGLEVIYTGPYVYRCHHLCYQNGRYRKDGICRRDKVGGDFSTQKGTEVFERSKDGIKKADYILAWIDDEKCFGTLVELGFAHSLGKKIYIAYGNGLDLSQNLWFAFATATYSKKFLNHERGIAWCLQMIKKDLKIKDSLESRTQCFGCSSEDCHLRKAKIKHCWKCGQKDYLINDCPLCGKNKKVKLE